MALPDRGYGGGGYAGPLRVRERSRHEMCHLTAWRSDRYPRVWLEVGMVVMGVYHSKDNE